MFDRLLSNHEGRSGRAGGPGCRDDAQPGSATVAVVPASGRSPRPCLPLLVLGHRRPGAGGAHRGAPAELGPLLDRVRALAGEPEAFTAAGPHGRADWLVGLLQLRDAVDAALPTALAAFDTAGDAATLHALSTATWLRAVARLAPGDATERVAIARATHGVDAALAEPHAALAAGRICYDQLRAIHHAVRTLPHPAQPQAVTLLTDLAQRTDTQAVRVAGRHLRHVVDPDGALTAAETDYTRRRLTLSPLLDGMTALTGLLDPEAATWLTTALAPHLTPAGPHDTRTPAQRRADGLVDLLRTALATAPQPPAPAGQHAPCCRTCTS